MTTAPSTPSTFDPAAAFDPPVLAASRAIGAAADALGIAAYFVGGVPRDLLLGRPIGHDLDVVAVGDAIALAGRLREAAGGAVVQHPRFGTATWRTGDVSIDLVTARRERYRRPGALPDVTAGTLDDDLARRDFTMNTLAFRIGAAGFGPLIDPNGGRADLEAGVVRILHAASFEDDPTRIVRAARAEARYGFRMDGATEAAARAALDGLGRLSAARLRNELRRLFVERSAAAAIRRLERLGALDRFGGGAPLTADDVEGVLERLDEREPGDGANAGARFLAWLAANGEGGVHAGERLRLDRAAARDLAVSVALAGDPALADPGAPASDAYARIERARPSPRALRLAGAAARGEDARRRLDDYAREAAERPFPIDGHDLVALGVAPGERLGRLLGRLRAAWWDQDVSTAAEALALAARWAAADRPPPGAPDAADARGGPIEML